MPRRRRKNSASQRKPSLIFTESPVNQTYNYESPVRCADRPTTARVVPVEELADLTWVSPQFHGQLTDDKGRLRRRTRHSRSHMSTRSRTAHSLHTSFAERKQLPRGFVPLRLEWDQTEDGTEIEDISEVETDGEISYTGNHQDFECAHYPALSTVTPPTVIPPHEKADSCRVRQRVVLPDCSDTDSPCGLDTTRTCHTDRLHPKILFMGNGSCNSVEPVRRSERLRARYEEAVKLLRSPMRDTDNEPVECRVLVTDTPECEYGRIRRPGRHKAFLKPHLTT